VAVQLAATRRAVHWADVFLRLPGWSGRARADVFLYFFFFAVLVASFSRGSEGISVTLVSFVLFVTVRTAFAQSGSEFEFNRSLDGCRRPSCIRLHHLARGRVLEHLFKRRLRLLREINNPWHPALGREQCHRPESPAAARLLWR
jgi:hypothetical protein